MPTSSTSKGFIQLEWVCPNCNSRNAGPNKTCENCGAPQPENVQFYAPAEAKLIQDANTARVASAGPDIYCPFCGTRNPATATVCSQCGGDLTGGKVRAAGREMKREAPLVEIKCTNCGEMNPSTRTMCSKCGSPLPRANEPSAGVMPVVGAPTLSANKKRAPAWLGIGAVVACLALLCAGAFLLFAPSKSVSATVQDVYWQTSVPLQEFQAVHYSDEAGSAPGGAYDVSCRTDTRQVCEDKTIDKGNGYGEVVTECHDENQEYCSYTLDEWQTIQTFTLDGHDLNPFYADPQVSSGQRLGDATITFTVYFFGDGREYTYSANDLAEFQQFVIGSSWTLHLNALGIVVSVE